MSKMIALTIIPLISLLSFQTHAAKTITLNPKETKSLSNNGLWTVNANCRIKGHPQTKGRIRITVLKQQGSVNGKRLSSGQATSFTVRHNSNIVVSAEAGTEINLSNLGSEGLEAVCST